MRPAHGDDVSAQGQGQSIKLLKPNCGNKKVIFRMNKSSQMMILVTGATGSVGPCVVQALCEAGHTVRTFSLDSPHEGEGEQVTECGRDDVCQRIINSQRNI